MGKRLRVHAVLVQPVCFLDDGENLESLAVQPLSVPWTRWAEFVDEGLDSAIAGLRADHEEVDDPALRDPVGSSTDL